MAMKPGISLIALAASAADRNPVQISLGSHKGEPPAARERLALLCTLAAFRF
jgi:hypothetical protein